MNRLPIYRTKVFLSLLVWLTGAGVGLNSVSSQSVVPVYTRFADLSPVFQQDNDTTYVINFWATWCKPCVKELPYFEEAVSTYAGQPVKLILVSLDFPNQIESRLIPFIRKHNLQADVVVLTDPDANAWIPQIAEEWSGAIPATLVRRNSVTRFREGEFEDLKDLQVFIDSCNN